MKQLLKKICRKMCLICFSAPLISDHHSTESSKERMHPVNPDHHHQIVDAHSLPSSTSLQITELSKKFKSLSAEILDELRNAFRLFDANGDGKISVSELELLLRSLGDTPSGEELQLMLKEADANGDGFVDLEEFVKLHARVGAAGGSSSAAGSLKDDLKQVFNVFDADKNGYISAEELHHVLVSLGDSVLSVEDCRRMIRGVDADGDGFVNFEEFQKMMTKP